MESDLSLADKITRAGLTKAGFGRLIGASTSTVSRWTTESAAGRVDPPGAVVVLLDALLAMPDRARSAFLARYPEAARPPRQS